LTYFRTGLWFGETFAFIPYFDGQDQRSWKLCSVDGQFVGTHRGAFRYVPREWPASGDPMKPYVSRPGAEASSYQGLVFSS